MQMGWMGASAHSGQSERRPNIFSSLINRLLNFMGCLSPPPCGDRQGTFTDDVTTIFGLPLSASSDSWPAILQKPGFVLCIGDPSGHSSCGKMRVPPGGGTQD